MKKIYLLIFIALSVLSCSERNAVDNPSSISASIIGTWKNIAYQQIGATSWTSVDTTEPVYYVFYKNGNFQCIDKSKPEDNDMLTYTIKGKDIYIRYANSSKPTGEWDQLLGTITELTEKVLVIRDAENNQKFERE